MVEKRNVADLNRSWLALRWSSYYFQTYLDLKEFIIECAVPPKAPAPWSVLFFFSMCLYVLNFLPVFAAESVWHPVYDIQIFFTDPSVCLSEIALFSKNLRFKLSQYSPIFLYQTFILSYKIHLLVCWETQLPCYHSNPCTQAQRGVGEALSEESPR